MTHLERTFLEEVPVRRESSLGTSYLMSQTRVKRAGWSRLEELETWLIKSQV